MVSQQVENYLVLRYSACTGGLVNKLWISPLAGVFAAAFDLEMEWVVIKGISDYADGTKGATAKWRPFASTMAASVVANILKNPVVFQNWHNYSQDNSRACTRTSSEGIL